MNGATAYYCNGTIWRPTYLSGLGSVVNNPGGSCQAIVTAGDYLGPGLYYIATPNNGGVLPHYCVNGVDYGGDGTTMARASASCSALKTYFSFTSGFAWVDTADTTPNIGGANYVYCLNGVSQGGNGANSSSSAVSCSALFTYWGQSSGMYYVGGTQASVYMLLILYSILTPMPECAFHALRRRAKTPSTSCQARHRGCTTSRFQVQSTRSTVSCQALVAGLSFSRWTAAHQPSITITLSGRIQRR